MNGTPDGILRGRELIHPMAGRGIYAVCPLCGGGDLVYREKTTEITCLNCNRVFRLVKEK